MMSSSLLLTKLRFSFVKEHSVHNLKAISLIHVLFNKDVALLLNESVFI